MATNVIMPALGMAQDTGTIVRWLKTEGETVMAGEPLMEVETDKTVVEIEAPAPGILARILVEENETVPVAQVVAVISSLEELEAAPDLQTSATPVEERPMADTLSSPAPISEKAVQATPMAMRIAREHQIDLREITPKEGRIKKADVLAFIESREDSGRGATPRRIPASPKARRLMQERGISPAEVTGTGPEGAIIERDVLAFEKERSAQKAAAPPPTGKEIPVSTTWQAMAEHTARSWAGAPHFYLMRELNAAQLITWREKALARNPARITYTDLLVKVVAMGIRRHPRINAIWQDGKLIQLDEINIGVAMAIEDGLVVPAIRRADRLGLNEIAMARLGLMERARNHKLHPEDVQSGSITLSNLGMYGVDAFHAVLNGPQAAILAVGRIAERVVPVNGEIRIQPRMVVSLSCDHRVIDGTLGALFLQTLAEMIEDPLSMMD